MHGGSYHIAAVLSPVVAFAMGACTGPSVSEPAIGTLTINLATSIGGRVYRLRDATITVTGPDSVQVFHTEDLPDRSSLSANVPAGAYSALLDPGWQLERLEQFSQATVNAELASDNPLHFRVGFGQRTVMPLRFRTNIGEVDLTQGYDIELDVEEVAVRGVVVSSFFPPDAAGLAVFAPNANRDTAPLRTIDGIEAPLVEATGVAVAGDEIIVADRFYPAINVFPRDGSGLLPPSRRIAGIQNEMVVPSAIAVYQGEMYVADRIGAVLVFPLAATDDVAPTRKITDLSPFSQIAIDRGTGELYVPEGFQGVVRVFPASASGPATAIRTIGGPHTGFVSPSGVAVFGGFLFISDFQTGDIRVFSALADGDATPLRVIRTAHDGTGSLGQLSVARDEIYVVNRITGTVDVFPINATGALSPTRSFAGGTPDSPFELIGVAVF